MRVERTEGIDYSHGAADLTIVEIFRVHDIRPVRFSSREDRGIPVRDPVSLCLLDRDAHEALVDGLTGESGELFDPLQSQRSRKRDSRLFYDRDEKFL